jgi:aminopeptidase YwaD
MKKIHLVASLLLSLGFSAQTFIQAYQDRANLVTQTNINTYLQEFTSYGIKKTGTVANTNTLNWLKTKYQSFGYTATQIVEDPFNEGGYSSKNLIVTKTGTLYPNEFIIICGHFDTVTGPGANDNGSGVAVILEVARILKNIPTEYSIKFINFSGEEQGLYGSYHYVENVVNATNPKMNIKLVFNIDQVGGKIGNTNNTIFCDRDMGGISSNNAASQQITQQLANCTEMYSPLQTGFDPAYASDYVPFEENGEIITGFYEYTRSYTEHTVNDTYANVDKTYVYNVAKAAVGAVQHFSVAHTQNLSTVDCPPEKMLQSLKIYPNPATDVVNIEMINASLKNFSFTVTDSTGKALLQSENEQKVNISQLQNGIYFGTVTIDDQKMTKKFIVKK